MLRVELFSYRFNSIYPYAIIINAKLFKLVVPELTFYSNYKVFVKSSFKFSKINRKQVNFICPQTSPLMGADPYARAEAGKKDCFGWKYSNKENLITLF
jgi:hypothetical protein